MRALITLLIVFPLCARAETPARNLWHADVAAPRPGLPSVTVDLGYPGPYVPAINVPIALGARAAHVPFHGYIGYHFAVRGNQTIDIPVVSAAWLRPGEPWSFRTILTMQKSFGSPANAAFPRELIIEWRDRDSMATIAQQSAGTPPWTSFDKELLPLRIVAAGAPLADTTALGSNAYVERADALPDRAQWYRGFSVVVAPLETWLALPKRVREAIFGSGLTVALFGLPRPGQQLDQLDTVLLPVTFSARPGSYDAPWPYRGTRAMPVATPLAWTAKDGADFIGAADCPYLVRTQAAAWSADEMAMSRQLPSMTRLAKHPNFYWTFNFPKNTFFADRKPAIAAVAAFLLSLIAWFFARRIFAAVVAGALILTSCALFAGRDHLRAPSALLEETHRPPVAPGIVDVIDQQQIYGPAPLPASAASLDRGLTGDNAIREMAEVRQSETAPSMGLLKAFRDWDFAWRWSYRRELAGDLRVPDTPSFLEFRDFHGSMGRWRFQPSKGRSFELFSTLHTREDGRVTCVFGIPRNITPDLAAELLIAHNLLGDGVTMSWAGGTLELHPVKRDIYSFASCAIPTELLRRIAEQGGIVELTFRTSDPVLPSAFAGATIRVQEKKS